MDVCWGSPFPLPDAGEGLRPLSGGDHEGRRWRPGVPSGPGALHRTGHRRSSRWPGAGGDSLLRELGVRGESRGSGGGAVETPAARSSGFRGGGGGFRWVPPCSGAAAPVLPRAGSSPVFRASPAAGPEPLPPPRRAPPPHPRPRGGGQRRVPGDRAGPPRYRAVGQARRDRPGTVHGRPGDIRAALGGVGATDSGGTSRGHLYQAPGIEHRPRYRAHGGAQPGPLRGAEGAAPGAGPGRGVPGGTGEYRNRRCYPTSETGCSGRSAPPGAAPTGTPRPPRGLPGTRSTTGGRGGGAARGRRKPKHRLRGGGEVRASPWQRGDLARCRLREREGSSAAPSTDPLGPFSLRCLSFPGPPPAPQCRCPPPARP